MKTKSLTSWCAGGLAAGLMVGLLPLSSLPVTAAEGEREGGRDPVPKPEQKERALRAEGQRKQLGEVRRDAEDPRAKLDRREREPAPPAPGEEQRQNALKRKLKEMTAEAKELRAAGKKAELAEVERRVERLQDEVARFDGRDPRTVVREEPRWEGRGDRPAREKSAAGWPEGASPEQRFRHLQAAIENLRAAGLPGPAEKLARLAERRQQGPGAKQRGVFRGAGHPGADPEGLRAEVQELRQAVRELRNRLEETTRERR